MKVNGAMLLHQISRYFNVDYAQCSQNIWAKTPIFYNIFFDMNEHIVLVYSQDLEECIRRVNQCILICLDKPNTFPNPLQNDLIILDDPIANQMILNILTYILDLFNEWELQLNEAMYKTMSFQDIIELIGKMLEVPISLINQDFRYIAYSRNLGTNERFVDEHNQLPLEDATTLLDRPDFKQLETITEAFTYIASESVVYKNIYNHHNYVGRLGVLIDESSDVEYFKAIFDYAAFYIESLYAQSQSFEVMPLKLAKIHEFLNQILNQEMLDKDAFQQMLLDNHAQLDDIYHIIYLTSNDIARTAYSITYLCSQIEHMWSGAYCVPKDEHIVLLLNESLFARSSQMNFHEELIYFIRDGLLLAGISREFSNIYHTENIFDAYLQAAYAMEQGRMADPISWYYYFDQYALNYLIQNGSSPFRPEQICHPALLKLIKHDQKHETSFTKTLFIYVQLRYNAVASAKALYIHRSSFINRMQRIKELVKIDWDNMDERLYLLLSFKLLNIN